jgi:hypothetical protein
VRLLGDWDRVFLLGEGGGGPERRPGFAGEVALEDASTLAMAGTNELLDVPTLLAHVAALKTVVASLGFLRRGKATGYAGCADRSELCNLADI